MCDVAEVSRSGYRYHSKDAEKTRRNRDEKDEAAPDNILKAYKFKNIKKGARQIKMPLEGQHSVVYNLKHIRRIMKKYDPLSHTQGKSLQENDESHQGAYSST